ncbi:MAG: alpha/beta hydrolase family protein [Planctomycetota bacterium]
MAALVDSSREGNSFGGYLTAWTITQTDHFKASVVDAIWTDLVFSNLTTDAGEPLRVHLDGNELERREFYRSRSPLRYVENCRTPTLVLHGALDRRVPVDPGRAFHRELRHQGGDGHLSQGRPRTDQTRQRTRRDERIKDWFDRHLLD